MNHSTARRWMLTGCIALLVLPLFGGEFDATFEVGKISAIPNPKKTAYKDCLVGIKGTVRSLSDSGEGREAVLLFDLFRNRQLYPAAKLEPGQTLELKIVAFDEAAATRVRGVMQANDFFSPHLGRFYVVEWKAQTAFENARATGSPARSDAAPSSNTDLIRRVLMAHGQEVTGGLIDDRFFWVHTPRVLEHDFWKEPEISKKDAIGCREAILKFHQSLEEHGIRLVVAPVPRSTSIYPGMATNIPYDPEIDGAINQPVRDLLVDLESAGVTCVDLTRVFLENRYQEWRGERYPIYRRNDTHWSGAGVRLAAQAIVARLGKEAGETRGTAEVIESPYTMPVFDGREPRSQPTERELIFRAGSDSERFDPQSADAEVHLLGDSFVNYGGLGAGSYGLHAHLVDLLETPVKVYTAASGGPMISRSQFARSVDLEKAKLVIWVFAESFLMPADIWFDVPLGDPSVINLEFTLDSARPGAAAIFSPMEGLGSGIELPRSGSVIWDDIEIGPGDSYPKWRGVVELKPTGAEPREPAKATFSLLADGELLASKRIESTGKAVRSPNWEVGLKKLADRKLSLELKAEIETTTPAAWKLRWTIPQLKNAGFEGAFEPSAPALPEPTVAQSYYEKRKASQEKRRSHLLRGWVAGILLIPAGVLCLVFWMRKKKQ